MNYQKKIIFFLIIFIIFVTILSFVKKTLLYYPTEPDPVKYMKFYQKLLKISDDTKNILNPTIVTDDGIKLDCIYVKNPEQEKCIIICHGNAGNISMRFDIINFFYNYGSVIIFDYRSYGKSTGDSSSLSDTLLQIDLKAVWEFAINKLGINPNDISLFGESLGCAVVVEFAAKISQTLDQTKYPHSVILNSPFYSLTSMIENIFNKLRIGFIGTAFAFLLGYEYCSDYWIKYISYSTDIIIAHSPKDEMIPYKEAVNLFNQIRHTHPACKFINISGTHNTIGITDNYINMMSKLFN